MSLLIVNLKQIEFNASMKNLVAKVVRAGGRSGVLGLVYALPLVPLSCPAGVRAAEGATVEVETPPVKGITYLEAPAAAAAFGEFQAILRGYSDVFLESEVLSILKEKEISLEQFEEDVAAYVLKENERGYAVREEDDYAAAVQNIKLLRYAMTEVSEKAEALHKTLLNFARKSVQTACTQKASTESDELTAEGAELAYREFSLSMVRLFARDLVAFRSHAQWLDGDVQSESPNRAPRSIAVSQFLRCNGNNAQIVMNTGAARHLWERQVEMLERELFTISDSWEEGHRLYRDSISRMEWTAPLNEAENAVSALEKEWEGVSSAYAAYMNAWELAFAPMPGYRGSGTPYWCADMCMHMFSHWEELVSSMLFRNQSEFSEVNKNCFKLRLPKKYADAFADEYLRKLSDAVKRLGKESEETEAALTDLRERAKSLFDARMRCAIAGISCEFYGDEERIAEETEKAHKLIKLTMLQDITDMCCKTAAKEMEDKSYQFYSSRDGAALWRNKMRLLVAEIGNAYENDETPEPFSGETNPAAASFSDVHVQRIQDLIEETDSAWNWYRRYWSNLLVCLSDIPQFDSDMQELRLHALREQWLKDLYQRAYSQNSSEDEIEGEN